MRVNWPIEEVITFLGMIWIIFWRLDFHQVLLSKVLYEDGMTFLPECGTDCISLDGSFFYSSSGFIMISCMSDLLEGEIQRLGASLSGGKK